jgi:hypothetical protein
VVCVLSIAMLECSASQALLTSLWRVLLLL